MRVGEKVCTVAESINNPQTDVETRKEIESKVQELHLSSARR